MGETSRSTSAEYKYWNNLPDNKHHFYKIMISKDWHRQLIIPKNFTANFKRGQLLDWCILRGPSGLTWKVDIHDNGDDTLLGNGWSQFVQDHNIETLDLLVFRYTGSSSFDVLIFEANACERASAYFVGQENNDVPPVAASHVIDVQDAAASESSPVVPRYPIYYESNRRPVTQEEEHRTYSAALGHTFRATRPCVLVTLLPTSVYKSFQIVCFLYNISRIFFLTIPQQWAEENIPKVSHDVELRVQPNGLTWRVGCLWTNQCKLRAGWKQFSIENNLEEHDVCVFELVEKRTVSKKRRGKKKDTMVTTALDVYIYRVVEDLVRPTKIRLPLQAN